MSDSDPDEIEKLHAAISGLEAQREALGGGVVDSAIAALRQQLTQRENTARRDERKLVTIVFCDIAGFTALAEKLDPEKVRELINACFDRLVPVVQKYDGTIDKFIGDEIMALFGAPLAHEDDPERALRAALEMMETLTDFNHAHGTSLGLHFGINTGLVVAGEIGGRNRREYSVMGDAVNLAARLEEASAVGEIFVGPTTYRLTSRIFEYEVVPPLVLKGKEAPVEVHRLVGPQVAPKSTRGIEGLRSSLVGRDAELAILRKAIAALEQSEGSALAVIGEAGLGKSRLIEEARALVPEKVRWAEGRALSYSSGMSYWLAGKVVLNLFGFSAERAPRETAEALRQSLGILAMGDRFPYLARMLELPLEAAEEERVKFLPGEALQARILEAVRDCVRAWITRQPLILFWEDLHWCDPSSKQVFEMLRPLAREGALLILSAARPEEIETERADGESIRVRLTPLTREESGSLIRQLLRVENLPENTRELILSRAEGNPFFLEELLRALIDAGAVVMEAGRAVATREIAAVEIPETVQGVLAARIDRLQAEQKEALQRASVIGRIFPQRVLEQLYDEKKRLRLPPALAELQQREFINTRGQDALDEQEYIFKHAISHEVAYGSILLSRRQELHGSIAAAIEQLFPERIAELSATLGFHFDKAERSERAAFYLARAADAARAHFANAEAIAYYQSAIRHAELLANGESDGAEGSRLLHLYEGLGDVLSLRGEQEQAQAAFASALTQCSEVDAIGRSRFHRKIGLCHSLRRNYGETARAFDRADVASGAGTRASSALWWEEKLQIQFERMHLFYWQGMVPEMRALAGRFEAAITEHGTPTQRSKFLKLLALSLLMGSRFHPSDECVDLAKRAVEASENVTDLPEKAHTLFVLGLIQVWHGEYAEAADHCCAALQLAQRVGDLVLQARCLNYRALALRRLNNVDLARTNAGQTLALALKLGMVEYVAMARANLSWVAWKEGRLQDAKDLGNEALALWHGMEEPLSIDWIALWPLIAAEAEERNVVSAIDLMRGFFSEAQHPLDDKVMAECQAAIDGATSGDLEGARQSLDRALQSARACHYL